MLYQGAFVSDDLMKYKPSLSENEDGESMEELQKINPDICGWLTIDDTHIDYPVVQGETDMEYVNKDVYGEFALSGSIFLDSQNNSDFSDSYSLVYGHHMENGAMFGDVISFAEKDYFQKHLTGMFCKADGSSSQIEIFACMETDAYDSMVYQPEVRSHANMEELLDYIRETAVQYRDIGLDVNDRMIALSTCAQAETNGRVIVFGRMKQEKQVDQT